MCHMGKPKKLRLHKATDFEMSTGGTWTPDDTRGNLFLF